MQTRVVRFTLKTLIQLAVCVTLSLPMLVAAGECDNPTLAKRWFSRHGTDSCDCGSGNVFVTINPANNQYNAKSTALVCSDDTGSNCAAPAGGSILANSAKTLYFKHPQQESYYSCDWTPGRGNGFSNPKPYTPNPCSKPALAKRWFSRHGTDSCDCGSGNIFVTINPANNQYNAKSTALVCTDNTVTDCTAPAGGSILASSAETLYFKHPQQASYYSCDWTPGRGNGFSNPMPYAPGTCSKPVLGKRWFSRYGTDSCDCGSGNTFVTINPANNQYNAKSTALVCTDDTGTNCTAPAGGSILTRSAKTFYFKHPTDNSVYSCDWTPGQGNGFSNPKWVR
jgi:hypothetical protein